MTGVPPQQQVSTRGQRLDDHRNMPRSYAWPGNPTKWTVTIGAWAAGTYSFDIDGITITSTTSTDANTVITEFLADFNSKTNAKKLAFGVALNNVLTLQEYGVGSGFTLTNPIDPGAPTNVLADVTTPDVRLEPGKFVAQDETNPAAMRELRAGDTVASPIGVTTENDHLALSTGDPDEYDGWEPGTSVSLTDTGLIPVAVEGTLPAVGNAVYIQIQSPGTEDIGAVRTTADGANTAGPFSNIRYNGAGYLDLQGRATVDVIVGIP